MLVLMLGELDYQDKLFPKNTLINLTKKKADGVSEYIGVSESEDDFLQFAGEFDIDFLWLISHKLEGTAHFFFAAYIILFSIIIMNLLIGLAVSDIKTLMESASRGSIISQIQLVNDMMDLRSTPIYRFCVPAFIKQLFEG